MNPTRLSLSACPVPAVSAQTPFCPVPSLSCRVLPPRLEEPLCQRKVLRCSGWSKALVLLEGRHGHMLSSSQASAPSQIGLNPTTSWNNNLRKCILGGGSSSVPLTARAVPASLLSSALVPGTYSSRDRASRPPDVDQGQTSTGEKFTEWV